MKKFVLSLMAICMVTITMAQKDPKAKAVLDKASSTFQSYATIQADFSYTLENRQTKTKETQKGIITLKGDKYQMNMGTIVQYFDGLQLMTWLKDSEEVQISETSDEEISNPSQIFTLYQKNYKYFYRGQVTHAGIGFHEVEISPEDLTKPFSKVVILINKKTNLIDSFTTLYKNGSLHKVSIGNFKFNKAISDKEFTFDEAANPDVEVIDVR